MLTAKNVRLVLAGVVSVYGVVASVDHYPGVHLPVAVAAVLTAVGPVMLGIQHYLADPSTGSTPAAQPGDAVLVPKGATLAILPASVTPTPATPGAASPVGAQYPAPAPVASPAPQGPPVVPLAPEPPSPGPVAPPSPGA